MDKLVIKAGASALKRIKEEGLQADMISGVVAAAGGPKWFTTYGLVRYIIADLIAGTNQSIHCLGASVGSWQMAAACSSDAGAAIDRLRHAYIHSRYQSAKPSREEISEICHQMIRHALSDEINYILDHPKRSLQVVTARGRGWLNSPSDIKNAFGFGTAFLNNAMGRRFINNIVERVVWRTGTSLIYESERDEIKTTTVSLTQENFITALRASGAVPYVMKPMRDIKGGPRGAYWDGGMTDYHISLPYRSGIILQPHFLPYVLEGWMDKKLPYGRRASMSNMDHVVLIYPSSEFVASLPRKQISDMKDFYYYGEDQDARIAYWTEISNRSLELGAEFKALVESGNITQVVQPYSP